MDSKAQRKALFRSRLRETSQKREKRIDSPLVRYNEDDQPVCRVCNVALRSDSLWPAHQASRKHHEAIENIKATAARQSTPDNSHLERQQNFPESRAASTLPDNFFDSQDAKKQKHDVKNSSGSGSSRSSVSKEEDENITAGSSVQSSKQMSHNDVMQVSAVLPEGLPNNGTDEKHNSNQKSQVSRDYKNLEVKEARAFLPSGFFDRIDSNSVGQAKQLSQQSEKPDIVQLKQVKEALPEGFFDNKDEDLRARGIEPVKVDIDDAYKEFEREIQEDLQEVDDRLEEEEIDAAEVREEIESLEYKAYRERVEMVKKKLLEAKESRLARLQRSPEFKAKDSSDDSSSDDEVDEDFSVDWRAKRF
ncbi:zinc finger protein 830 [Dendrobium catenatum]|uniref:zinc finger protein 830 n=1 Tax=Dendrobium catenatum TaxID=906689 RepID=UPI0009F350DD|nr:zinc finger protein 830 [Dendrobium catenatum]